MAIGRREGTAASLGAALMLPFLLPSLRHGAYADPSLLANCLGALLFGALTFAVCSRVTAWMPRSTARRAVEGLGVAGFVTVLLLTFGVVAAA